MNKKKEIAYVTSLALTKGIIEVAGVAHGDGFSTDMYWIQKGKWFRTMEEAVENAEEMRKKKILSLEKQIERLSKLDFTQAKP